MKTIAIVMTVHNRKEKTLTCIRNILQQKYKSQDFSIQIFLTNDGCTDGTPEKIKEEFPLVHIINGDGSLFWNRGMLKAWQTASKYQPDYYLWLNDDTILNCDAIDRLYKTSEKIGNQSIIVGSTCNHNGELTYGGRKADKKHTIIPIDENIEIECQTFNGNIVLIPSYVYDIIGYNDPYFHHSFGDIEYGLRASKKGIKSFIAPGYYGICERNNPIPIFRRKQYSLFKRYKLLYSPLGFNPLEDFHLNKKYYPLHKAILWFIKLHLNVLFTTDHTQYNK
jgi:GT2 family glycosyltransferase